MRPKRLFFCHRNEQAAKPWAKSAEQLAAEQAQQMEEEVVEESSSEDESTPQPEVAIVNEIEMEEGAPQGTKVQETQEEVEEKEEETTPATD